MVDDMTCCMAAICCCCCCCTASTDIAPLCGSCCCCCCIGNTVMVAGMDCVPADEGCTSKTWSATGEGSMRGMELVDANDCSTMVACDGTAVTRDALGADGGMVKLLLSCCATCWF